MSRCLFVSTCLILATSSLPPARADAPRRVAIGQAGTAARGPAARGPVVPGARSGDLTAADATAAPAHHPGRVLVKLRAPALAASTLRDLSAGREREAARGAGLPSFDAICRSVGAVDVARAFSPVRDRSAAGRLGTERWFELTVPEGTDVLEAAARFADDPDVEVATPDWEIFPAVPPNDPLYATQWGHENTGQFLDFCWDCGGHDGGAPTGTVGFDADAEAAWARLGGHGDPAIVIAIIDSGVDADHPDLRQVAGWDYGSNDSDPDDDSARPGHGTACAGVAAAIADNALGVAGIAGGCSIMPLKVANDEGRMFFSAVADAIYHAADNGADIISLSLAAAIDSHPGTADAITYAHGEGLTLFAATSNENATSISHPANHPLVISVGAASPCGERKRSGSDPSHLNPGVNPDPNGHSCDGERWWGSSYGVDVPDAAGAVDLLGPTILPTTDIAGSSGYTTGDDYRWFNGTSCATPYVAGVAALVKSANPTWTHDQIRQRLVTTAVDVVSVESPTGWDRYSGYGMVNAAGAVGGAASGGLHAELPYSTGFEDGALDQHWMTSSTGDGRVRVLGSNGPHGGTRHLVLDDATRGGFSRNEAWLHLDLSGHANVDLDFAWKDFSDESHGEDGVFFSDDGGGSFVKVLDLDGPSHANDTWQSFSLDVDDLAAANGLSLTSTFVVKLQQQDNFPVATDGHAYDDLSVTSSSPPAPTLTLTSPNGGETLTSGDETTITWASTGAIASVALDVTTDGGVSWTPITSSTADDGAHDWTVVAASTTLGRIRVSSASDASVSDTSDGTFTIQAPPPSDRAPFPYSTGFEDGVLDAYWTTATTGDGRVRVLAEHGPRTGSAHLVLDDSTSQGISRAEAWLRVDLSGATTPELELWWKEFGDETHAEDGIFFSDDDGDSFTKVLDLDGAATPNDTWQRSTLDVDQLAATHGLALTDSFVIKLQQHDNYPVPTDGFAFDDLSLRATSVTQTITAESEPNDDTSTADEPIGSGLAVLGSVGTSSDEDWFAFEVTAASDVDVVLDILGIADLDWYLYRASDTSNWVARGYTTANPESGSFHASAGRYYLLVDGYQGATSGYALTVTGTGLAD